MKNEKTSSSFADIILNFIMLLRENSNHLPKIQCIKNSLQFLSFSTDKNQILQALQEEKFDCITRSFLNLN